MYLFQGGGAGGPEDVPPVHVHLGDDEEDGEEEGEEADEDGQDVPQPPLEGAQGDGEGVEGGEEGGMAQGGANGEAQMQHLGPGDDAERMSSSSPSSLFRYQYSS